MIWEAALAGVGPRVVQAFLSKNRNYRAKDSLDLRIEPQVKYLATSTQSLPLLRSCNESQDVVQNSPAFKPLLEERNTVSKRLWINPKNDIVYMEMLQFYEFCYRRQASCRPVEEFEDIRHLALAHPSRSFESMLVYLLYYLDKAPKLETLTLILHGTSCDRADSIERYYWNRCLTLVSPCHHRIERTPVDDSNILSRVENLISWK
jgi:hypothetical protein